MVMAAVSLPSLSGHMSSDDVRLMGRSAASCENRAREPPAIPTDAAILHFIPLIKVWAPPPTIAAPLRAWSERRVPADPYGRSAGLSGGSQIRRAGSWR